MSVSEHAFLTGGHPVAAYTGYLFTVSECTAPFPDDISASMQSESGQCGTGMIVAELNGKIIISYIRRGGAAALSGKLAIKDEVSEELYSNVCPQDTTRILAPHDDRGW